MAKWTVICTYFTKVMELIDEEIETAAQCMKIMSALETCCDELTPNNKSEWEFYDDFRDLKSEIHEEIEFMDEDDYESCEDIVDNWLNKMYDLCDAARVWLPLI